MQVQPAQIVPLAKIDPGPAQQGIGHGEVEIEVGDSVLMHAGMAIHPLAARPVGDVATALELAEIGIQLALQKGDCLGDMGAQIRHRLRLIPHHGLLAMAGGGDTGAGRITADQHLFAEGQHVDDQPIAEEVLHIELLRLGMGGGLGQAQVEVGQHLDKLGSNITVHGAFSVG